MEVLRKGSVESLLVVLGDRLGVIDDLADVTGLVFDTKEKVAGAAVQTGTAVVLNAAFPMTAICEIDTTLVGYVAGSEYKLYVRYAAGTEAPSLGPELFRIEDD